MKAHRHSLGHEHEFEPQFGLPEALPTDERVLWQGAPDWRVMARRVFHLRKLAIYFGALMLLRAAFVVADGGGLLDIVKAWTWLLPMSLLALGLVTFVAALSARTSAYTITNKRVVMRIGIVLTVTFNLPLTRIESAGLKLLPDGSGEIPLRLRSGDTIAWLQLWPHALPWQLARPQPMLRCVPDAAAAAQLLAQAWLAANGIAVAPLAGQDARASAANDADQHRGGHALAGSQAA